MFRFSRLAVVLVALVALAGSPARAGDADPARIVAAWHDLLSGDEMTAARAILSLSSTPKETVEFLRSNMLSLKVDKGQLTDLVKRLGDRDYHTREAAQRELVAYGRTIRTELEEVRTAVGTLNAEAQDRVRRVLSRIRIAEEDEKALTAGNPLLQPNAQPYINYVGNPARPQVFINGKPVDLTPRVITLSGPPPMYLRAARAIAVLEHIGTPDAAGVLDAVAQGEITAPPTRQAQEALARLKAKK